MEACDDAQTLKGPWSQDEDRILTALVQVGAWDQAGRPPGAAPGCLG